MPVRTTALVLSLLLLASCASKSVQDDQLLQALYAAALAEVRSDMSSSIEAVVGCAVADALRRSIPHIAPDCFNAEKVDTDILVIHALELKGRRRGFAWMSIAGPGVSLGCDGVYKIDFLKSRNNWVPEPYGVRVC